MKKSVVAGAGFCAIAALAFAAKDPVIMTVNGVDVPKSEFEYLYNKNSQQQINPQTLDEYVEMFKLYKMKVADARSEGIDTTAAFRKEAEQYRRELAAPYLADSVMLNRFVDEAYARSLEEVEANHIMLFKSRNPNGNCEVRARIDSIAEVLAAGGDFEQLAMQYSQDRGSNSKGGRMGWMVSDKYPITFELAAYSLPEGQISEVVESPVGYHILKGGKHRPSRGTVQVRHILRLTQGKTETEKAAVKEEIDSLYRVIIDDPVAFGNIAATRSEDPGSARQGGMLPWFGTGEMVPEFEAVAFELKPGEISEPIETAYGYHIIQKIDERGVPSRNSIKQAQLAKITTPQDPRYLQIRDKQTALWAKKHKGSLNEKTIAEIRKDIARNGLDSAFFADWTTMPKGDKPIFTVRGKKTSVKDIMPPIQARNISCVSLANKIFDDELAAAYHTALADAEEDLLAANNADYRNLLKEYIDGSLLYEVSVRKVWDRAAKDTEGLQQYFGRNRDNYRWSEPRAKGFLVQAANDSVASLIKERAAQLSADTLVNTIRKEFKGQAGIDKVLVSKGTNAMVDNIMFGGPEVRPANGKYQVYFMLEPRTITEPEEVSDVKGLVTSDYQSEFQTAWEEELRNKYPVIVYKDVLRTVKPLK